MTKCHLTQGGYVPGGRGYLTFTASLYLVEGKKFEFFFSFFFLSPLPGPDRTGLPERRFSWDGPPPPGDGLGLGLAWEGLSRALDSLELGLGIRHCHYYKLGVRG